MKAEKNKIDWQILAFPTGIRFLLNPENITNEDGLKSYAIRGISYTFLNKIEQSDNFVRGERDLFGVVEI